MDGGGGGGPAPFLIKTYEMVDDSSTDAIVSWSSSRKSFVVWNPPEFQRLLLPTYFKHNNFSSFIRQLNTYGFRKVDPERWEFANEDFMKDQKHLLKNIHRRKPIHSHSHPQGSVDPERSAFEEEIDRLSREKNLLEGNISGFKDQQCAAKSQLETLRHRIVSMEQKQERLLSFLEKAVRNPDFVERLAHKLDTTDFSAYNKKRRLPQTDGVLLDNQSDLCSNKLRLELSSPAVSDVNLLSRSTQSSNEDGVISPVDGWSNDVVIRTAGLELSDTGASFTLNMNSSLSCKCKAGPESPKLNSLHLSSNDEGDGDDHLSCLLDLTLASSSLQLDKSQTTGGAGVALSSHDIESNYNRVGHKAPTKDRTVSEDDVHNKKKQAATTGRARVNDVFWEQFLTERPGCSDNEEAKKCMD